MINSIICMLPSTCSITASQSMFLNLLKKISNERIIIYLSNFFPLMELPPYLPA